METFFFKSLLLNVTALLFVPVCVWFIELLKHAKVGGDAKLKTPNPTLALIIKLGQFGTYFMKENRAWACLGFC